MRFEVLIVALLTCAPAIPAVAADKDDVRGVMKSFESAINAGDKAKVVALCASDAVVIDDGPPHLWKGPDACSNWWDAYDAGMRAIGMSGASLKFGEPWQVATNQQVAYVVAPATFGFTVNGKAGALDGVWTWALKKTDAGWKIAAMACGARACADGASCRAAFTPGS